MAPIMKNAKIIISLAVVISSITMLVIGGLIITNHDASTTTTTTPRQTYTYMVWLGLANVTLWVTEDSLAHTDNMETFITSSLITSSVVLLSTDDMVVVSRITANRSHVLWWNATLTKVSMTIMADNGTTLASLVFRDHAVLWTDNNMTLRILATSPITDLLPAAAVNLPTHGTMMMPARTTLHVPTSRP